MSAEQKSRSHAAAWTLGALAVPVLYVLTLPLVVVIPIRSSMRTLASLSQDPWFLAYVAPYGWLRKTPLKPALDIYFEWAVDAMGGIL